MEIKQATSDDKTLRQTLRRQFREQRLALCKQAQVKASLALAKQYRNDDLFQNAKKVAVYITHNGELNTAPLIQFLWEKNVQVYLPVLHPFCQGHLLFIEYTEHTAMRSNTYGIPEPELDCTKICPSFALDLMFVPLVAFDDHGNRLGMGGGFYDRTLANFDRQQNAKDNIKPLIVGLAYDAQKAERLPSQAWDIPLPYVLTPTKLYRFY